MAAVPEEYSDSPIETDEPFPCKRCDLILEEGKAFELSGYRWHLDCFRCTSCDTLLDSDANLLLLGDGSLICNNCTYSCTVCGNKIEDLAILTGEQAFCATCFRCRNCKRKIENLRYARTSHGIFCMDCHETLMARRRKKAKAAAAAKARNKENSPIVMEKSLPALPPNAIPPNAFSDTRVDPDSDTPTELSARPRDSRKQSETTSRDTSRPARPPRSPDRPSSTSKSEGLGLPPSAYRNNRNSSIYQSVDSTGDDGFLIPVALDRSPGLGSSEPQSDTGADGRRRENDYFSVPKGISHEKRSDSLNSTPHIAFQDKSPQLGRDSEAAPSLTGRFRTPSDQGQRKEPAPADDYTADTKSRKPPASRSDSSQSPVPQDASRGKKNSGIVRKDGHANLSDTRRSNEQATSSERENGNSAGKSESKTIPRKELPSSANRTGGQPDQRNISDTYMQPRAVPAPPFGQSSGGRKDSVGSHEATSPSAAQQLARWRTSGGDFSLEEDLNRIMGADEGSSSILRRVSNAVRHSRTGSDSGQPVRPARLSHARSISETTRTTASPRWPKSPTDDDYGPHELGSPVSASSTNDTKALKRQLRNSEQRVAELERQFSTENDIKSLNKKLLEKRRTVSVLDTQTEIMIRQLEVLAGYVERAKATKAPIDPKELEDSAIKDFVQKLESVKLTMSEAIENLHEERDQVVEEKNQAMADRDRALMEFEQLSSKNAQLADMNNDLTHQIQERFKSQIGGDGKLSNGLGIYSHGRSATGSAVNLDAASVTTGPTLVGDEDTIVEGGPTVVQVRKGQVRKFNWKKGSKTMAQNVAKGVNRAVVAFQQNDRERMHPHGGLVGDNIGLPYNMTVAQVEAPAIVNVGDKNKQQLDAAGRQGFGFFGKKNAMPKSMSASAVSTPAAAEPPSTLFGSELAERTEYERRQIPAVVTRCIEEVELRGMDQEGIYRKTGGNSQVNSIREGFERNENFDISDPDMDITAVTSVLKQYFRRLPTPLLTFEVYEKVLESNAIADEGERCTHLRKAFASMPDRHRDCLEFLMFHLHRVAQREGENLMSPKNLAVVFAPTIMRDLSIEREMTDMHAKNIAVQFVIENTNNIFAEA